MAFDLFTGLLKIAGQPAGGRCQQPEHEKPDAVDTHAADFRLPGYHHQIKRVERGKKQAGSDAGSNKGWPEYSDNAQDYGYLIPPLFHGRVYCGFHHGLRPQR